MGSWGCSCSNLLGVLSLGLALASEGRGWDGVSSVFWSVFSGLFLLSGFCTVLLVFAPSDIPNRSLLLASLFFLVVASANYLAAHFYFVAGVCFSLFLLQISLWLEDERLRLWIYFWTALGLTASVLWNGLLYWLFITPILVRRL